VVSQKKESSAAGKKLHNGTSPAQWMKHKKLSDTDKCNARAKKWKLTRFQTMHCRGEQVCSHRLQAPRPTAIHPVLPRLIACCFHSASFKLFLTKRAKYGTKKQEMRWWDRIFGAQHLNYYEQQRSSSYQRQQYCSSHFSSLLSEKKIDGV